MEVMKWAPQSPDLNPIENLCNILKSRLRSRPSHPRNADHLFVILQQEWMAIPDAMIRNIVLSMSKRIELVKRNHGGPTKY